MRKFLGTITLFVICIAIVGGLRHWFRVEKRSDGDNTEVHLLINRQQIRSDTQSAREAARELRQSIEAKLEKKFGDPTP